MKLHLYQIDAFTDHLFGGNPAAVVPLKKWLSDELLQQIAMENQLSETVYFVPSLQKGVDYDIRWFTPMVEIDLCGHATLATAFVVFSVLKTKKRKVTFHSKSGVLSVEKGKGQLLMDFPSWEPQRIDADTALLKKILGVQEIVGVYKKRDVLVELPNEKEVAAAQPDFSALLKTGEKYILTAPGTQVDFVSRFFAPSAGVPEDPVTGSAHSQLIPFWSNKLGKKKMKAEQWSNRKGVLYCEQRGERVIMGGQCVFYMEGTIKL
jgi:PhzF family phenazine biosynthesis protein